MEIEQVAITQAIMQAAVETMEAVVQTIAVAAGESNSGARSEQTGVGPKLDRPTLEKHTFNWVARDKYMELKYVTLERNDIYKAYNVNGIEKN